MRRAFALRDELTDESRVIDTFCWQPNCLETGKCLGIRFVPDPATDTSVVPLDVQTAIAKAVLG